MDADGPEDSFGFTLFGDLIITRRWHFLEEREGSKLDLPAKAWDLDTISPDAHPGSLGSLAGSCVHLGSGKEAGGGGVGMGR